MIWIDLVIVGALLLGLGLGAKRGFLQTLGGVAATVVSFIGAGIAAGADWLRAAYAGRTDPSSGSRAFH